MITITLDSSKKQDVKIMQAIVDQDKSFDRFSDSDVVPIISSYPKTVVFLHNRSNGQELILSMLAARSKIDNYSLLCSLVVWAMLSSTASSQEKTNILSHKSLSPTTVQNLDTMVSQKTFWNIKGEFTRCGALYKESLFLDIIPILTDAIVNKTTSIIDTAVSKPNISNSFIDFAYRLAHTDVSIVNNVIKSRYASDIKFREWISCALVADKRRNEDRMRRVFSYLRYSLPEAAALSDMIQI